MLKAFKNVVAVLSDLAAIGTKEIGFQVSKASNASESRTKTLADKVNAMRKEYEDKLEQRKEGKKAEVVSDAPSNVINVN